MGGVLERSWEAFFFWNFNVFGEACDALARPRRSFVFCCFFVCFYRFFRFRTLPRRFYVGACLGTRLGIGRFLGGQDAPKMAQDGAKTAQDGAKIAQDGAKTCKDRPKTPHDDAKTGQYGAKTGQDGAKTCQNGAKSAQNGAMTCQDGAKTCQDGAQTGHDGAKMGNMAERAQLASAASDASGALQMFLLFKICVAFSMCPSEKKHISRDLFRRSKLFPRVHPGVSA